jgi:hypothetical protein
MIPAEDPMRPIPSSTAFLPLPALALWLALALFAAPAQAAIAAPDESGSKPAASDSPKASVPNAQQVSGLAKAVEANENKASQSIDGLLNKAPVQPGANLPPPGSPPRGGRKTIYGDIIIHK